MDSFYINKTITLPGDSLIITGSCVQESTTFLSSNNSVGIIQGHNISIVGIGETNISELSSDCDNTGSIMVISTDNGEAPFMTKDNFLLYNIWETVFLFFVIFVLFLFKLMKR